MWGFWGSCVVMDTVDCANNWDREVASIISSQSGVPAYVSRALTEFARFRSLIFLISIDRRAWSLDARRGSDTT